MNDAKPNNTLSRSDLKVPFTQVFEPLYGIRLSPLEKLIISDAIRWHLQGKVLFASQKSIAERMGVSRSTIQRAMKNLNAQGYLAITITKRGTEKMSIIEVGEKTITLLLKKEDLESIQTSEPVDIRPAQIEPSEALSLVAEYKEASKTEISRPEPSVAAGAAPSKTSAIPEPKGQQHTTSNSKAEPNGMLIDGIWHINPNGPIPKTLETEEQAGEIWSLFGLPKEEGISWYQQMEEKGWTTRNWPIDNRLYHCAYTAYDKAKTNVPAEPIKDESARVQGGTMEYASDPIPMDVFRSLDFNPTRGKETPSISDAIKVLGCYGVVESLARESYASIIEKGWPDGNRLDVLKRTGANLKANARRANSSVQQGFSYANLIHIYLRPDDPPNSSPLLRRSRIEIDDKVEVLLWPVDAKDKRNKSQFLLLCGKMMREGYVAMYVHQVEDEYEMCVLYRQFLLELRKAYRQAIQTYADYTIGEFNALDRFNEKLASVSVADLAA